MKVSIATPQPAAGQVSLTNNVIFRGFLLMLGVLGGSTAVIMIKASTEHPVLIASYRLLVAAVVLTPFFIRELRKSGKAYTWQQLGWSALPALALAAHFISWVIGARMTNTANASLLVNMLPLALPFFLWIFYKERVTIREVIGTVFALGGVVILSAANVRVSFETFLGDMICLGSMLAFACYMALGRKNGERIGLWTYLVPLYYMAGLICLVVALFFINPIKAYDPVNLLYILGLGIIPTVIGHSLLNYSLKFFRGQVVGIANLGQVIFAGIMGVIFFHEIPGPLYFVAAVLIISGILIVVLKNGKG